jgi:predicted dehydrogenase
MEGPTYKAGIIGLGFIGAGDQVSGDALGQRVENLGGSHSASYAGHPRVELVAGSSRDEGRRQRFSGRSGGVRTYTDWQKMLEAEDLDIVSVATYTHVRADITIGCAERGVRAIYCEKPIASTVLDGERMVAACEQSGSLLVVNHNRRFESNHRALRDLIARGGLGQLTSAIVQWSSGRLGNVGTHMFDALRMLTGREVLGVVGVLDMAGKPDCRGDQFRDPGGWGMFRLEDGIMATVTAPDYGMLAPQITLCGTEGRAVVTTDIEVEYADGRNESLPRSQDSYMDVAIKEMVDWLDGGSEFGVAPADAVRALEVIAAFHVSEGRNGSWVTLPLSENDKTIVVNSG